jgi:hypothetical protein
LVELVWLEVQAMPSPRRITFHNENFRRLTQIMYLISRGRSLNRWKVEGARGDAGEEEIGSIIGGGNPDTVLVVLGVIEGCRRKIEVQKRERYLNWASSEMSVSFEKGGN